VAVNVEHYYEHYGPMVLRRCRQLLGNEDSAMDAMQEVFVKVLTKQDVLEDIAPSSLLYRMATNTCLNRLRTQRRRPETCDNTLLMNIAEDSIDESRSLARRVLASVFQNQKALTATMAVLHWRDGFTLQEVADEVGMSVSGVRKRLRKLRRRLHAQALPPHPGRHFPIGHSNPDTPALTIQ